MAEQKFIPLANVPAWLDELAEKYAVFAPRREGKAVVYRPHEKGAMPELAQRPTESAKHIVFPRAEELFHYSYAADPAVAGKKDLRLHTPEDPSPAVVFGALSCDARGFFAFDPVYNGSGTGGMAKDTYYLKRRAATAFIVLACRSALSTCFCTWTGGNPASTQGADVLATEVEGGYLLHPVTDTGKELLGSSLLQPATDAQDKAATASHEAATKSVAPLPGDKLDPQEIGGALLSLFDDMNFWMEQSAGCLSCGACTYLCPTCYCFNITDETTGIAGTRLRSWDNCMSPLFTLEASGHNPRTAKAARLKNRVGHKFSYYPSLHEGRFSCCGCGRCIKSCPSSVDIRRIVQNAIASAHVKENTNG